MFARWSRTTGVEELIDSSYGPEGLRSQGLANWHDLRRGGRYEEWLAAFDDAIELLKETQ